MLIGDVLGLPFIPWILAEPIGKAAAKFAAEIPAEKKKAKKAAKRRGADAEAVEAELLGRPVKLKLPTTAEISATVKALAKACRAGARTVVAAAAAAASCGGTCARARARARACTRARRSHRACVQDPASRRLGRSCKPRLDGARTRRPRVTYSKYNVPVDQIVEASTWETKPHNLSTFLKDLYVRGGWGPEAIETGLMHALCEHTKRPIDQIILVGDAPANNLAQVRSNRATGLPSLGNESYWSVQKPAWSPQGIPITDAAGACFVGTTHTFGS